MNTRLHATREQFGKTQAQVAKEVGISEQMYQRYEHDKNTPNVRTAIRIARALNSTVEDLFGTKVAQCRAGSSDRPTR